MHSQISAYFDSMLSKYQFWYKQGYSLQQCLLVLFFLSCYLAAPRPTLGHSRGDSLTNPMLITAFFIHIRPEGHRGPRNKVGSLSPAERLVGFEPGTFRFILQRLNPLGHYGIKV